MLKKVTVQSDVPKTFDLNSIAPTETLILTSISGLSAVDVDVFSGDYAGDGGYYQGRRTPKRNVVLNFKMKADFRNDFVVSDCRELLYRIFMDPNEEVDILELQLEDDRRPLRRIYGVPEKIETDEFSKDTNAMVSLICSDPYLETVTPSVGSDSSGWTLLPLDYEGSARGGLKMTLTVKTATNKVTVTIGSQIFQLENTTGNFAIGDVFVVDTRPRTRFVTRNGLDAMKHVTAQSRWIALRHGVNQVKVYGSTEGDGRAVLSSYEYNDRWWGI